MKFSFVCFFILFVSKVVAQNLINNFGFQYGDESRMKCKYRPTKDVLNLVDNWQPIFSDDKDYFDHYNGVEENTYDWVDFDFHFKQGSYCQKINKVIYGLCIPITNPSNRMIERRCDERYDYET